MKIVKTYSEDTVRHAAQFRVDTRVGTGRYLRLTGNLWIPLDNGSISLFPYEDYWVKLDDEIFHVDSKAKFDILANKIMTQYALEQL